MGKISCKTNFRTDELDERGPLNILLIESSQDDTKRFRSTVESGLAGCFIVTCKNVADAIALARESEFEIAVLGDCLGTTSLLENVRMFADSCPNLPLIVLTEIDDEAIAQASIDFGAQDYLVKPVSDVSVIQQRMLYAIARHAMIVSDRVVIQQLKATSQLDPLTKLNNRAAFDRESERQVAISNRNGTPLSIGMIDADFFKSINDKYGHMVGDQVLVGLAQLLTTVSRVSDIPCRFGGEEFCVILPDTDDEQAFVWAERVCRSVRESKIETRQGPISITVSIGTATLIKGATKIDDALEQADAGCLEAKSRGRDQVVVATSASLLNHSKGEHHIPLLQNVKASDVMSTILMTIPESMAIANAASLMLECHCEAVPVVTPSGTLRGLLTNEEIVSHVLRGGSWNETIESIAGQTVSFPDNTPFSQIWGLFQRLPIRRAIVTCGEKPVGIINRGQLLRRLATSLELSDSKSELPEVQANSSRQIFNEIKRTAEVYLMNNAAKADSDEQDFSLLIAATQLQELASELLQLSSPSKNHRSSLATSSAAALVNL